MAFDLGTFGTGAGALTSIAGGIFSGITGSEDASKISNIQKQMAGVEIQENETRRNAMELTSRRQSMENVRQAQLARSMSLNAATNQGAQFGSGLAGGQASISGQTNTNQLGVNQNLQLGEKMFDYSGQMDELKMALSDAQSQAATDAGIGKLIGGLGGSMGNIGKLGGLFFPG